MAWQIFTGKYASSLFFPPMATQGGSVELALTSTPTGNQVKAIAQGGSDWRNEQSAS